MPASAFHADQSLNFRGVEDSFAELHVEGSECCLIHADNLESSEHGVFLNPNVRVGYNVKAYRTVHPPGGAWVSYLDIWLGLWRNRLARWFTTPMLKEWMCRSRQREWESSQTGRREKGGFCLINEMQIIVENGWAHV